MEESVARHIGSVPCGTFHFYRSKRKIKLDQEKSCFFSLDRICLPLFSGADAHLRNGASKPQFSFFSRYIYFYIPILSIVLQIVAMEFDSLIKAEYWSWIYRYFAGLAFMASICLSFFYIAELE